MFAAFVDSPNSGDWFYTVDSHSIIFEWYELKLWSTSKIVNENDPNDGPSPILWVEKLLL